jgi:hypothetical protein
MLTKLKENLKSRKFGKVEKVTVRPSDSLFDSWVDVQVGNQLVRLLVPREIIQNESITPGDDFSWEVWKWQFLNVFLNPIQDVTEDHTPSLDHLVQNNW